MQILSSKQLAPNNAINADGLGQRAIGASPKPAGYGERYGKANSK